MIKRGVISMVSPGIDARKYGLSFRVRVGPNPGDVYQFSGRHGYESELLEALSIRTWDALIGQHVELRFVRGEAEAIGRLGGWYQLENGEGE